MTSANNNNNILAASSEKGMMDSVNKIPPSNLDHDHDESKITSEINGQGIKTKEPEKCQDIHCTTAAQVQVSTFKSLSFLDRFLAIWILLSMALGIILGYFVPEVANALQNSKGSFVGVSIPIAIGLLVMMYPILCKVQYETLHLILKARSLWIHFAFSIFMNWIIAPLFMVALAWAFLPDDRELREGLIIVGIARCIAMVLIWTNLASADLPYCAMLVALNSILQIVLFAPFSLLYINSIAIDYSTVAISVAVFLGIPLGAAVITRLTLFKLLGESGYSVFIKWISPLSLLGLLFTIIVLFACQSANIVRQVVSVCRVAAPLIVYFIVIFTVTLAVCRYMGRRGNDASNTDDAGESDEVRDKRAQRKVDWGYARSTTQALTAASNNFELAIAVAVAAYGVDSKQALAATVGPLIEVPVLLGLVEVAKWLRKRWNWE